ncbi:MAG: prephenate dehydratase [Lachnospiraceae bacterium]|jgi:chorismate mutase/prephenate dehydratase|nr:prephenate dehydratase [Lachnospiraceae bacterium]
MDLQECRNELDKIDKELVRLFEERMKICGNVAEYKIAVGKPVYDGEREKQKLAAVTALAHGKYNRTAVQELFTQLMTISRRYQYSFLAEHGQQQNLGYKQVKQLPMDEVRVVYQGVEGAYSHAAALQYFGESAEFYHVLTFEEAMQEVKEGRADYGVLPIENSTAGAVIDNYDLQIKYNNYIVAETFVKVRHVLLGCPDAELSDIRTVFSHPQALMQCSDFLNERSRIMRQISLENTALAAKKVVEERDKSQAAIASEIAGRLYGLKVLQPEIQNNKNNTTRFIVLSKSPIYRRDAAKISITFELPHRSGTLYNILGHFIFNGVNMRMIESRPIPGRSWEYRFFVDIEGNLADAAIQNALNGVAEEAQNMRILGNY